MRTYKFIPQLVLGLLLTIFLQTACSQNASGYLDQTPRIAVMSAFEPELNILRNQLQHTEKYTVNGVEFITGRLNQQNVVLVLSGISMVNAAMNTQLLFDRFNVQNLVFSGIAGGVNPEMYAAATKIKYVDLDSCDQDNNCVLKKPKLKLGGYGVSGQAFVDNAAFREYVYKSFNANVLDMETAACAMVAYSNGVPFLAFRSLSDLAGGGKGENEMYAFMHIAAANATQVLLRFLEAYPSNINK